MDDQVKKLQVNLPFVNVSFSALTTESRGSGTKVLSGP